VGEPFVVAVVGGEDIGALVDADVRFHLAHAMRVCAVNGTERS
jgi:hypothetical protein